MLGRRSWGGKQAQTLVPLLALGILLVSWDRMVEGQSAPERAAVRIVNVVAMVVGGGYDTLSDSAAGVLNARHLARENERLRAENAALEAKLTESFAYSIENKRLTELLELKTSERGGIAARVVAVEAGTQAKRLTVSKGRQDGLGERHIALAPAGLVGRALVDQLAANTAKIALIIDPRSGVAAEVAVSGDRGIVVGTSSGPGLGGHMLTMDLAADAVVHEGDEIRSSGHGGVYPGGYRIGRVVSVERNLADASQIAQVEPFVDFAHLETLLLIPPE